MDMIRKLLNGKDENLSVAFCSIVLGLFFTNLSQGLFSSGSIMPKLVSLLSKAVIFLLLLMCIRVILERVYKPLLITTTIILIVPILQFFLFRDSWSYFSSSYLTFLLTIFPGMICFAALRDYQKCLQYLIITALGISIINLLVLVFMGGSAFTEKYSMGYANAMILPTNLLIYCFWRRHQKIATKITFFLLVVTNVASVLAYGSRGSLVAIAVFFLYAGFKTYYKEMSRKVKTAIIAVLGVCVLLYRQIFTILYNIMTALGFYSRTLLLLTKNIGHDSGRSKIWNAVWSDFSQNPFLIRGINADHLVAGNYSHNFFLELLHALGIILGGAVCIYIIVQIVRTCCGKTSAFDTVKILLLFAFFPVCLWSSSVWTSMYFWLWIVICWRKQNVSGASNGG